MRLQKAPSQRVRAPGKQHSVLFSARTGRQAPEWWRGDFAKSSICQNQFRPKGETGNPLDCRLEAP